LDGWLSSARRGSVARVPENSYTTLSSRGCFGGSGRVVLGTPPGLAEARKDPGGSFWGHPRGTGLGLGKAGFRGPCYTQGFGGRVGSA
jgi:hypothetical protein